MKTLFAGTLALICSSALNAQSYPLDARAGSTFPGPTVTYTGKLRHEMSAIRAEGLQLQQQDGGRLTPAHRAYIQHRIDLAETTDKADMHAACIGSHIDCADGS